MPRKPKKTEDEVRIYQPSELREIADTVLLMEAWCKAARVLLTSQAQAGVDIPGVTTEPSYSPRSWDDKGLEEKEIVKVIQGRLKKMGLPSGLDVVQPRRTLSPAQVEKITGKPLFEEHLSEYTVQMPTGNHTLKIGSVAKAKKSLLTKA